MHEKMTLTCMVSLWLAVVTLLLASLPLHAALKPSQSAVNVSLSANTTVTEGDGSVQVCASISASQPNVTLTLTTVDGTAMADSDYISTAVEMSFTSDSGDMLCTNITITDDSVFEEEEVFTVVLNTSDPDVVLAMGQSSAVITIQDDEKLMIIPSQSLSVLRGDHISLHCTPAAPTSQQLNFTWTHLDFSTILEETSNVLTLPRIYLKQLGTYLCSVASILSPASDAQVTITNAIPLHLWLMTAYQLRVQLPDIAGVSPSYLKLAVEGCISVTLRRPLSHLNIAITVETMPGSIGTEITSKPYNPDCDGCQPLLVPWPDIQIAKVFVDGDLRQISCDLDPTLVQLVMREIHSYLSIFQVEVNQFDDLSGPQISSEGN